MTEFEYKQAAEIVKLHRKIAELTEKNLELEAQKIGLQVLLGWEDNKGETE